MGHIAGPQGHRDRGARALGPSCIMARDDDM